MVRFKVDVSVVFPYARVDLMLLAIEAACHLA
jgi:hypothetical protein